MWLHPCVWVEASKTWHWLLICPTSIVVPLNPLYVHLLPLRMLILLAGPQPCHQLRRLCCCCCLILCLLISNNHDVFHIHDIHIHMYRFHKYNPCPTRTSSTWLFTGTTRWNHIDVDSI